MLNCKACPEQNTEQIISQMKELKGDVNAKYFGLTSDGHVVSAVKPDDITAQQCVLMCDFFSDRGYCFFTRDIQPKDVKKLLEIEESRVEVKGTLQVCAQKVLVKIKNHRTSSLLCMSSRIMELSFTSTF